MRSFHSTWVAVLIAGVSAATLFVSVGEARAGEVRSGSRSAVRLAGFFQPEQPTPESDVTHITTREVEKNWDISGPISLRSADPEEPGEVAIKNIFGWSTTRGANEDDDFEYELEIEWGITEDHELIFELPFELGDGRVDGNGDLTVGWHWRLWKEEDWRPAFAMRNFVRFPTGYHSNGFDYEWRGLFTKSLVPDVTRLHLNPFFRSVNGDNEEDARHFQWGVLLGVDHRINDSLVFITDYKYENGEIEHTRDNHTAEFGLDWKIDERQTLGLATFVGLDGDSHGESFGVKISYILNFGG